MFHATAPTLIRLASLALLALACSLVSPPGEAAEGAWKEKTQVVWNKQTGTLVRKSFRVWDPHPELDLDFLWEPRLGAPPDGADSTVSGPGTLTWRDKGAPSYDRRFIYSVFKGLLKNGRPEGSGALMVRDGTYYTGEWVNGAMQGRGNLRLANGDRYEGDFVAGSMHGVGKYNSTDGSIYLGEFRRGLRDGIGRLTLIDGAYRTTWHEGREIERQLLVDSPRVQNADALKLAALSSAVKLKLSLDYKKANEFANSDPDTESHTYEAEHAPGSMTIHLGSKPILNAWKGDGALASGQDDGTPYTASSAQFAPLFLSAELENTGTGSARITGAFLDVTESISDLTPYLQLYLHGSGGVLDHDYNPEVDFVNFGWGRVRDARVIYSLGGETSRTEETSVQLGNFDTSKSTSFVTRLRQLGVNVDLLRKASMSYWFGSGASEPNPNAFRCDYDRSIDEEEREAALTKCLDQVKNSGVFGKLKDHVFRYRNSSIVVTTMAGRIEYRWAGADGKTNSRVSPFSISFPLLGFEGPQAEGGDRSGWEQPFKSSALSLDRRKYRVALPKAWDDKIGANETNEFGFILSAPKASHHVFQLVVQLADGNEVRSPTVDLSYFRPRIVKDPQQ